MPHPQRLALLATVPKTTATSEGLAPAPAVSSRPVADDPLADMRFQLLGPLVIRHRGVDIAPSAPKLRRILSMLLFHANQPVGASVLIRELWNTRAPRTAHATLQTYMYKVRKLFQAALGMSVDDVARHVLRTSSGGYTLRVDPRQLDIVEFDDLVTAGTAAMHEGRYEQASTQLRRSLALWRGNVHQGDWGPQLRAQAARLEERRFYAHTTSIDADLCLGRHREVLSELASLVVEHPLNESAHAMLMVALYRSGRASAAPDVYLRLRQRMINTLGIGPSERLRALHRAVLSSDPLLTDLSLTSDMLLDRLVRQAHTGRGASSSAVTT